MKKTARGMGVILPCLFISLFTVAFMQAKGWRGLVPLHSERVDVERLLGPPANSSNEYTSIYHLENETVIFNYEGDRPCETPSGWRVPRGTVVSILITPKSELRFSDLRIDKNRFKKTSGGHRPEDVIYTDNERGESITVYQGDVTSLSYFPAASDGNLRCPDARNVPSNGGSSNLYHTLDTYHDISFEAEKSALDNFAISLLEDPKRKGYIVAYAGRREPAAEAQKRAVRAKNYLITERGIGRKRVVTMAGGYREEFTVELYLVPRGAPAPTPTPTVNPRAVQSIEAGSRRNNRRSTRPRHNR